MKYKILDNGKAYIISRHPELITSCLNVEFIDAPDNATAIFDINGTSYYRKLSGKSCSIDFKKSTGIVKVTLADFNSKTVNKWICEEIMIEKINDSTIAVLPNDMNLPMQVVQLASENESIRLKLREIENKYNQLVGKIQDMLEGYDLV